MLKFCRSNNIPGDAPAASSWTYNLSMCLGIDSSPPKQILDSDDLEFKSLL